MVFVWLTLSFALRMQIRSSLSCVTHDDGNLLWLLARSMQDHIVAMVRSMPPRGFVGGFIAVHVHFVPDVVDLRLLPPYVVRAYISRQSIDLRFPRDGGTESEC